MYEELAPIRHGRDLASLSGVDELVGLFSGLHMQSYKMPSVGLGRLHDCITMQGVNVGLREHGGLLVGVGGGA